MAFNSFEIGAMATAGIGGVTAFWSQVSGFFIRLKSLVFITADLRGYVGDNLTQYAWTAFKPLTLGNRSFQSQSLYIIPEKRFGHVVHERPGEALTFFNGWRPLFISLTSVANMADKCTVSFIRGTFDLEKLLFDSTQYVNRRKHEGYKATNFYVKKIFGRGQRGNSGDDSPSYSGASKSLTSDDHNPQSGLRPIGFTPEEIGAPTSKMPFENLSYEVPILEFKDELKRWKDSKDWHRSKGIPWRFGCGLYGPPGGGKSSFIRAVAQELDLPVHIYDLTAMTNRELVEFWAESLSVAPCMVVFEDIDRIFDKDKIIMASEKKDPLTLDCLLNCINGIQSAEGILVMVTANDITKVDPALGVPDETGKSTRPGRLDRSVYFGSTTESMRLGIAKRILSDCPDLIPQTVAEGNGDSGAQFESRCSKLALQHYWGGFKSYSTN